MNTCTHSFPDPFPQPMTQPGDCRNCGISYQEAKRQRAVCGQPHCCYPESLCTRPAGHYRRGRDSHAAPLTVNGHKVGAVVWDEPSCTTRRPEDPVTTQPTPARTHIWDGTHTLPDWLGPDHHHWNGNRLAIRTVDGDSHPRPGWMLIGWSDGAVTIASPRIAEREYGPDGPWARAARAEDELRRYTEAESADAAAGSYAGRAESAEQQRDQLTALVRDFLDPDPCRLDHHGYCQAHLWMCGGSPCPHARAREALAALDSAAHAIAQPGRWLHIVFTSPDETTANTSALAIADHLRAEFDGVSMRITTNATEPNSPAATEATDIETTARVFAALHRSAEETVTRVTGLYEQWVKAGPPPLGVSLARWWDARLVELREAIQPPADTEEN